MTLSLPAKTSPWQAKSLKYLTLLRTENRPSSHSALPQGHAGARPSLPHQGQPGSKSRKQRPARGRRVPARPCLLPGQLASKIFPAGVLPRYFPQRCPPWFKLPAEAGANGTRRPSGKARRCRNSAAQRVRWEAGLASNLGVQHSKHSFRARIPPQPLRPPGAGRRRTPKDGGRRRRMRIRSEEAKR